MFSREFQWKYGIGDLTLDAPDGSTTIPGFIFPEHIDSQVSLEISKEDERYIGTPRRYTYRFFKYDHIVYNFLMKVWANPEGFLRITPLHCTPRKGGRLMVHYMARLMLANQPWPYEGQQGKENLLRDYAKEHLEKSNQDVSLFHKTYGMRRYKDDCQVTF